MVEKNIRDRICHAIYQYMKVNNKYMKNCDRNKESYLKYWAIKNLYGWAILQKLPLKNHFKWVEETLNLMKIS